ncbi:hypothetical protein HU200_065899 [Digitaria exilis]|uniref:F-box domain-containing protein n=1 Tax=Digitaria exilis TaxID=1010633 RepID=A0A834ZZ93_9POAL|nr:hypothetical protein HU200_065899 [Digitaria exilis]
MAGGSGAKKRARRRPNPAALLTDDLLVEILTRVPYRSLCRFRCVSTRWRALIAHPDHRARLPQTLTGFLYGTGCARYGFANVSAAGLDYGFANVSGTEAPFIDAAFSFLPDREREHIMLVDCCNGLLLCRSYRFAEVGEFDYLVLNPATEKWVAVPGTRRWWNKVQTVRLGFDPAVSPHFYVFEFQSSFDDDGDDDDDTHVLGVKIYSSATGVWIHKQNKWIMQISLHTDFKSVFLDGVLYVSAIGDIEFVIGAVDVEGETWRIIKIPRSKCSLFSETSPAFIDLSQGQLHLANVDDMVGDKLAIYVREDKDSVEWTLKHTVSFEHLVGTKNVIFGFLQFIVVAIHPDHNMVFFVFGLHEKTLRSYDMDSGKVYIIRNLGRCGNEHFLPYVPLFSKTLPDGGN